MTNSVAKAVIRRDRSVVLVGLTAVIAAATAYTINMAQTFVGPTALLHPVAPGRPSFLMLFTMWALMQVAMMSPTAVPMLLLYAKIARHRQEHTSPLVSTALVFLGYVIVWAVFSLLIAAVQMGLQATALLSPMMASSSSWLSGSVLVAAGLFQFSHLKQACLSQCRSPVTYFMTEWRNGHVGALLMGLNHGVHCVGCCWILMALLFVAGVMNILWMAIIMAFVLIEKLAVRGVLFGRIAGVGLIVWGIIVLI
jgi:predicted metal-binding membrane protein